MATVDGAFFGTTFPHLFFLHYDHLVQILILPTIKSLTAFPVVWGDIDQQWPSAILRSQAAWFYRLARCSGHVEVSIAMMSTTRQWQTKISPLQRNCITVFNQIFTIHNIDIVCVPACVVCNWVVCLKMDDCWNRDEASKLSGRRGGGFRSSAARTAALMGNKKGKLRVHALVMKTRKALLLYFLRFRRG